MVQVMRGGFSGGALGGITSGAIGAARGGIGNWAVFGMAISLLGGAWGRVVYGMAAGLLQFPGLTNWKGAGW